jgi:hypothetical protein
LDIKSLFLLGGVFMKVRFKIKMFFLFAIVLAILFLISLGYTMNKHGSKMSKFPVPNTYNSTAANVWTQLTNFGYIGDDAFNNPSFEWPGGSGNHYLLIGSIWVAGKDPSNVIHCTAPDEEEITLTTDPGDTVRLFHFGDPYFQNRPNVHSSLADSQVSAEDTYTEYTDLDPGRHGPGDSPLGIKIIERTYKWTASYNYDYIIFDYQIVNIGLDTDGDLIPDTPQPLHDVYVGIRFDADVSYLAGGEYWYDDLVDYDQQNRISYMYDGDDPDVPGNDIGEFGLSTGYIGSGLLKAEGGTPFISYTDPVSHSWWNIDDDPSSDALKFAYMSTPIYRGLTTLPYDYRYLQSVGPFDLQPDDTLNIVWASGMGEGFGGLLHTMRRAKEIYDNNYLEPVNPQPYPPYKVGLINQFPTPYLFWEASPEPDVVSYNIYANGSLLSTVDTSAITFDLPGSLTIGTQYDFNITCVWNIGTESEFSDTVTFVYGSPTRVTGISGTPLNGGVSLHWNVNPEGNITGYNIYRDDLLITNITGTTFSETGLTNGNYYSYQITAVNSHGLESERSREIIIIPTATVNSNILLVDDYGINDEQIKRFFETYLGYGFTYTYWNLIQNGPPSLNDLQNYSSVVWFCGENFTNDLLMLTQVSNELRTYLNNDGNLWLSGSEVLFSIGQNYPPLPGDFEYDYLKILNWNEDSYNFNTAKSVIADLPDLQAATTITWVDMLNDPSLPGSYETITMYNFGNMGPVQPSPFQDKPCAVYYTGSTYKTVLTAFPLYNMQGDSIAQLSRFILNTIFGESYNSNPPPLPPFGFNISDWSETTIDLVWEASGEPGTLGYNLYIAYVDSGPYIKVNTDLLTQTYYTFDNLIPGTEYFFKISTIDDTPQEGPLSDYITEVAGRPHPVNNLLWTFVTDDGIATIQWDASVEPDIVNYNIYVDSVFSFSTTDTTAQINTNFQKKIVWVTAIDNLNLESDASDTLTILFIPATEYLLVVNGISAVYGSEMTNYYSSGACIGNHQAHIWDLFGDQGIDYTSLNSNFTQQFLSGGAIPDTFLFKYHKVIWIGNNYSGDRDYYSQEQVRNYLTQRGNFLLATRTGSYFLDGIIQEYCGIRYFYYDQTIDETYPLVSLDSNLVDVGPGNGYTYASLADFVRLESYSEVTPIFRWEGDGPAVPQRIAGFRTQKAGNGEFIYIAGRPYRLDINASFQNYDFIIENWLGGILNVIENNRNQIPLTYELFQNYPNPFNPLTTIKFGLPEKTDVTLTIYNILGQEIKKFENKYKAGYHEINWNGFNDAGKQIASGVYIYRMKAEGFSAVKKCLFLK